MVTFLAGMLSKGLHMVTFGIDRGLLKRHAVTFHRHAVTFHRHAVQLKMRPSEHAFPPSHATRVHAWPSDTKTGVYMGGIGPACRVIDVFASMAISNILNTNEIRF